MTFAANIYTCTHTHTYIRIYVLLFISSTPVEYISPDEQQLTELETLSDVTQDGTMLKVTYYYQDELYEVTESSGTHSKLQAG